MELYFPNYILVVGQVDNLSYKNLVLQESPPYILRTRTHSTSPLQRGINIAGCPSSM